MAVGSTINWSPQVKQLNLFSLPFLMPDYAAIDALVQGDVGREMFKLIEKAGVVPLAWGENGYRQLSNSKRDIKKPEDMKGMKLRVVGSPLYIDTFTALGANPTQMSWADAQPALASGAVDGQENPLSIIYTSSFFEVQKYLSLTGHVWVPANLIISKPVWNRLSADDKKIVQAAADKWRDAQRKMITDGDQQFVAQLKEKGMQVNEVDKAAFAAAVQPVWKTYSVTYGPELMAIVQKYREAQ
ncbi:hypothetical protein G6F57_017145 [Rhizopus arrhizus]|nr:hypothetical protein G6F57_017145 [Rhizopus arrhizus]